MELNNDIVLAFLRQKAPHLLGTSEIALDGMLVLETPREHIIECLQFLRDEPEMQFNFLTSLNTIHYPDQSGRELCLVYHLHNWRKNLRLRVKIFFPIADPVVPTATVLWPAANWMERQEYDFFGVIFTGHPNLTRILNVDDMEVFPLRKEYRLEDGTRTDKDDRFFGREGNFERKFD